MKLIRALCAAGMLTGSPAAAQDYLPLTEGAVATVAPGTALAAGEPLTCANPPRLQDLGTFRIVNSEMSLSLASKLGLPIGTLTVNGTGRVLVRDWSRSTTCLSTDGRTQLVYGQAIRVVAASDDVDASVGLTFGTIAANSTLRGRSSNIQAVVIGLTDTNLLREVNKLLGPLDVETYDSVKTLVKTTADLALTTGRTGSPDFLGLAPANVDMSATVLGAFAVQQISDGKTCSATKAVFRQLPPTSVSAIESAYLAIVGSCDATAPNAVARATAAQALNGLKVRK